MSGVALEVNGALDRLDASAEVTRTSGGRRGEAGDLDRFPSHLRSRPHGFRGSQRAARMGGGERRRQHPGLLVSSWISLGRVGERIMLAASGLALLGAAVVVSISTVRFERREPVN